MTSAIASSNDVTRRAWTRAHASLAGVEGKIAQIDRRSHTTVNLGIPATVNYPAF
jgi:hypothetical protein